MNVRSLRLKLITSPITYLPLQRNGRLTVLVKRLFADYLATVTTTTKHSTLCYLYGRMLLIFLTYALCPTLRATVWQKQQQKLSLLKLVRHFQARTDQ